MLNLTLLAKVAEANDPLRYIVIMYFKENVFCMVFANTVIVSMDHRKHRNMQNEIEQINLLKIFVLRRRERIKLRKLTAPLTHITSQAAKGSSKVVMNVGRPTSVILPF